MIRKLVSLSIALSFIVLLITGVLSYFQAYSRTTATLHTVFGLIFALGALFHLRNNFKSIKVYSKSRLLSIILLVGVTFFISAYLQKAPFKNMMDFGAQLKAKEGKELNFSEYEIIEINTDNDIELTIDLLRAEHFWHPQIAIWTEDTTGNFLQTLFVTQATAKGLFFGGRSKSNFKEFDTQKDATGEYRRVDALPVWSHKRGVQYSDGMYVPTIDHPLPDGISGATLSDNFHMTTSSDFEQKFNLRIEINVAFDDNEYYSEFDFPDDEVFHSGTGQLGQPSIIFETSIDMRDNKDYYLMELIGHGHHSGQSGELYEDLSTLTTALELVERIVVGIK